MTAAANEWGHVLYPPSSRCSMRAPQSFTCKIGMLAFENSSLALIRASPSCLPQLLLGMRQPFSEFAATDAGQDFTCALSSAANMPFRQVETVDPRDLSQAAPVLRCSEVSSSEGRYRADWEPAATSGRRALGVFWRCPAVLWGPSTPNPTQISWKPLILKNWPIFPASCGYVVVLPHVAQVRFWRPKKPHSE